MYLTYISKTEALITQVLLTLIRVELPPKPGQEILRIARVGALETNHPQPALRHVPGRNGNHQLVGERVENPTNIGAPWAVRVLNRELSVELDVRRRLRNVVMFCSGSALRAYDDLCSEVLGQYFLQAFDIHFATL